MRGGAKLTFARPIYGVTVKSGRVDRIEPALDTLQSRLDAIDPARDRGILLLEDAKTRLDLARVIGEQIELGVHATQHSEGAIFGFANHAELIIDCLPSVNWLAFIDLWKREPP